MPKSPITLPSETPLEFLAAQAAGTTVTKYICAAWAAYAYQYDPRAPVQGWTPVASRKLGGGFSGFAVRHEASSTIVFVSVGANAWIDFFEGFEAAFGDFNGPLEDGVNFMTDVMTKSQFRQKRGSVTALATAGHSWGGAIAEAQVALAQAALGTATPAAVFGVGMGSAGFEAATRAMAARRGWLIDDEAEWNMRHYIRLGDAIRGQPDHDVIGGELMPPTIYSESRQTTRGSPIRDWEITPDFGANHNATLYFKMMDLSPQTHLFRSRSGRFYLFDGAKPARTFFGTNRPGVFLDCP
ncbi:MAG: hypothetical protein NW203_12390 [Hyphomonadaceae bacterium]|nr:hypothetical protein [Hyphomonadaceae bacterium]